MIERGQILDIKKENAILSCLLHTPDLWYEYDLNASDFNNQITRNIFTVLQAISTQIEKRKGNLDFSPLQIDSVAKKIGITIDLDNIRDLRDAVGEDGCVHVESFMSYVQDLEDINLRLRLFDAGKETEAFAVNQSIDSTTALLKAENAILSIEDSITEINEPHQIEFDGDDHFAECLTRGQTGIQPGVSTGFRRFDDAVGGCRAGSLTVFAARAKVGKSLLASNIALNVFQKHGLEIPVLYLDTEMPTSEVRLRLWGILAGVNYRSIEKGDLTEEEKDKLSDARKYLKTLPLYHLYMPDYRPEGLQRLVRKWKNSKGVGLLIYDYIKLPDDSGWGTTQEWQKIGYLTNTLKNRIGGQLGIPVVSFAQLNRSGIQQAQIGEVDESSIGGSDRIVQYCSTLAIFRKANNLEMFGAPDADAPEWKRYGRYANRFMHVQCTRCGGDDSDPIPMFLNGKDTKITESGDFIPYGSNTPLSDTISKQIARTFTKDS